MLPIIRCLLIVVAPITAVVFPSQILSISISEKKAALAKSDSSIETPNESTDLRESLTKKKQALLKNYIDAEKTFHLGTQEDPIFKEQTDKINTLKNEILDLENQWKEQAIALSGEPEEALWHQPDTTIGQLVIDYGGNDSIYLMPPEIAVLKIHVNSELSIPQATWKEVLELTLATYGIGVKQLNPFLKQLYFMRLNQSGIQIITDKREKLALIHPEAKAAFVISPRPQDAKRMFHFLEKFIPHEQMTIQLSSGNIVIVALVKEIFEILKIYDFAASPQQSSTWKLVALQKSHSEEIAKILGSLFNGESTGFNGAHSPVDGKISYIPSMGDSGSTNFKVIPLKYPGNSLFIIGKTDQIEKACEIIKEIESKIGQVQEKTIYWYAAKHSEAEELAKVLSQVYIKLSQITLRSADAQKNSSFPFPDNEEIIQKVEPIPYTPDNQPLIVNPQAVIVTDQAKKKSGPIHENFIVDSKTNSIVMVVETLLVPKLKELLKKLDVPKKMVQLDVLLFEKRITDTENFGLNVLKLADAVTGSQAVNLFWNDVTAKTPQNKGILNFSMTMHKHSGFPAYNFAYNFLLSQDGVHINANPSVTTVNQTPAKIALVDEISINTGVIEVDTTNTTRLKDSFSRVQYGITIQITPTVHAKIDNEDDDGETKFITLETDVNFDTPQRRTLDDRPPVSRRNIKNEVRVPDGQTLILGGLRRKDTLDNREMIPFLGEIPGFGKLFSTTSLTEITTEMFMFITPKIIPDKHEEFVAFRLKELKRRPGEIPEFLEEIEKAKEEEKRHLFYHTLKMLSDNN